MTPEQRLEALEAVMKQIEADYEHEKILMDELAKGMPMEKILRK